MVDWFCGSTAQTRALMTSFTQSTVWKKHVHISYVYSDLDKIELKYQYALRMMTDWTRNKTVTETYNPSTFIFNTNHLFKCSYNSNISEFVQSINYTSEDVKRIFIAHMKEHTEKFTQMPALYFK